MTTLDVAVCPRCEERHDAVEVLPFKTDPSRGWFLCPVFGDPVMVSTNLKDEVTEAVPAEVLNCMRLAVSSGKWLVAVFKMREEGTVLCTRFAGDFPTAMFPGCIDALQKGFDQEVGPPPRRALPTAVPERRVNLFGPSGELG